MDFSTSSIARNAPIGVGAMLVGSGLYGVLRPFNMIHFFGLPWADESHSKIYPAVGARNLAAGVATIALSLRGQRESVGVLLASWLVVGVVDTSIVVRDPRDTQRGVHALNTVALTFISALAIVEGKYSKSLDSGLLAGLCLGVGAIVVNSWVLN